MFKFRKDCCDVELMFAKNKDKNLKKIAYLRWEIC